MLSDQLDGDALDLNRIPEGAQSLVQRDEKRPFGRHAWGSPGRILNRFDRRMSRHLHGVSLRCTPCAVHNHARHRGRAVRRRQALSRLPFRRPTHSRSVNRFASAGERRLRIFHRRGVRQLTVREPLRSSSSPPRSCLFGLLRVSSCEGTRNCDESDCLALANHQNWLVPMRRAQDANSRSAYCECQADSCTHAQIFSWLVWSGDRCRFADRKTQSRSTRGMIRTNQQGGCERSIRWHERQRRSLSAGARQCP